MGENDKCALLNWECNKVQRVVKATLSAEALGLCDGLSNAILIKSLLIEYLNLSDDAIPINAYVDNKSLTQAVHSTTAVSDDLLVLDISVVKEFLDQKRVNSINWVPGTKQLADCLTKRTASGADLLRIIQTGRGVKKYIR